MFALSLSAIRRPAALRLACRVRYYSVPVEVAGSSKVWNADEAVKDVKSGDVLLCGGPLRLRLSAMLSNTEENRIWASGSSRRIHI